ncbi:hypothetical protein N8K70_07985 [Microbacterium betulae]|uniref:Fe-S oxidoreductase n=1 Tax=Microbacterium betulae TaxID=2981139 RepID=A0AA97I7S7_9MICO|nr:hypothetical protein [Microbacterium sp. AB]WOF24582.1 hypothetical protein N8K70_07985 [Microbacterium sp. AB]
MRMGTRWPAGSTPPAGVPAGLRDEIARVEADLAPEAPHPSWTLTWLEDRPIAELDSGIEVVLQADGTAISRPIRD